MKKLEVKNRVYRLTSKAAPLSYMLQNRNTQYNPLMYFDGEVNRALRYARNQKTPFEDDQDENPILEPIVFVDGFLRVEKSNRVLQEFLSYHPQNGKVFEEVDNEKDARKEVDVLELEIDALSTAKSLDLSKAEAVARVLLGSGVDTMTTAELRRDIMVYAKKNPQEFLEMLDDPDLDLQNIAERAISEGMLSLRNNGREIFYNFSKNKKKLLTVPFEETPVSALCGYLKTDKGIELMKTLETKLGVEA
tara:strand:- start:3771 stop:4517 length:747 start_codon:yes stop_codon:yes gene_type:complete